ncbi:MAG: hypothetical protein LH615_07720 [Ferruginibacter sp.]|nr:hypothetical protein [Ferruginibacter sp.]
MHARHAMFCGTLVVLHLKDIGKFLMDLFPTNPQKAGLWGFVIDESKRKPKLQKSKLSLTTQITITGVVIGSTLTNTGTVDIQVYYGKTTVGTPNIVHAAQMLGIPRGGSSVIVVNPALVKPTFTVLRNR